MKVRNKSGQEFEVDEAKVSEAEADGFYPVVTNGKEEHAVAYKDLSNAYKDGFKLKGVEEVKPEASGIDKAAATLSGFGKGATMGFADELIGTAKGVGDYLLGKAAYAVEGQPYDQGTFSQNVNKNVAKERGIQESAQKQAPGYALAGQITGGVASGAKVPLNVGSALGIGGVTGLGESDKDVGLDTAKDVALGAGAGLAGYGLGKGIEKGIGGAVTGVNTAKDYLKAVGRGAKVGAKEANQIIPGTIGTVGGGAVGAVKEVLATALEKQELKPIVEAARKLKRIQDIKAFGSGKALPDMSDDDVILEALIMPGDNPVKTWVADRASATLGGNIDGKQLSRLLAQDSTERLAARRVDPRDLAEGLVPEFQKAKGLFEEARSSRFKDLQDIARQDFSGNPEEVVTGITQAIESSKEFKSIPGGIRDILEDAKTIINKEPNSFDALQKARQWLDKNIPKGRDLTPGEQMLLDTRRNIDDVLKTAEGKIEADKMYRASKDLEGRFFDQAEFKGPSGYEIDAGKIKRLLGNNDAATRFKNQIDTLEEFANAEGMPEALKTQAKALSDKLRGNLNQMELKRDLGSFRQAQGPSSPAIARLESLGGGGERAAQAIKDPQGFMNNVDQFNDVVQRKLGKPLTELEGKERSAALKMFAWINKNPNSGPEQTEKMWKQFLK